MRSHFVSLVAMTLLAGSSARAQTAVAPSSPGDGKPAPGWTFTPSLGLSSVWDDNPLIQAKDADISGDLVSVITPHAGLDYHSPRNTLSATYNGAFEAYRQLNALNNYGQFETLAGQRKVSSHTSYFIQQQFSSSPTTELPLLVGVPFVRIGARVAVVRGGIDHAFTKRTTMEASYDFQWIAFDKDPVLGRALIGGRAHSAAATVRHQTSARTALIADYEGQHAIIIDGSTFTVQNARAGVERRFSTNFSASVEGGLAHVTQSVFATSQTSPAWRADASRQFRRLSLDGSYGRSFVPAFGVGNALESEDLGAHAKFVATRRIYADASIDRRHDTPLTNSPNPLGEGPLRSLWFNALVGYTAGPWLHIEGFFTAVHQNVTRPGGVLNGNRVGIQVTTTKPMRVR